ncbi:hypothetical protein RHGRI_003727 [Rhododendron griersonianum]|uniref:S-protein homolog n=1 Tax=Rhododendron griersonianum TaxID=479676 RepID=A0AAV6L7Z0_9ERIC|nr:hypothetical protein RHGRI_003727 [Rhododendron griersonianum]
MARFLALVILIFHLLCMQTLCEEGDVKIFFKTTVHITSGVEGELRFHCKSKDDDLGNHMLSTGGYYDFHFHPNWCTLFFCHFYWNSRDKAIDVYSQHLAGTCEHSLVHYDCFWRVTPNGFYLSNDDKYYRGTRWWVVSVCTPHADGTFPERVVSCRWAVPLGGSYFQVMWAMEYNPNISSLYEVSRSRLDVMPNENAVSRMDTKQLKQYGKYERKLIKTGHGDQKSACVVFLVASVIEAKKKRLLKEAKGPDDVVKLKAKADSMGNRGMTAASHLQNFQALVYYLSVDETRNMFCRFEKKPILLKEW